MLALSRSNESKDAQAEAEKRVVMDAINAERERRIIEGVHISVTGYANPIALQGRQEDKTNLLSLSQAASGRLAQGNTTHQTIFRDKNNEKHTLAPAQVYELWALGAAWVEGVMQSSWVLKDMDPIPSDFTDDGYW